MQEPISEVSQPDTVLPSDASAATPPSVLNQQSLSPQEIERICRCFIRLIQAAEEIYHEELSTTAPTRPLKHLE
jgi:hypothetical protein